MPKKPEKSGRLSITELTQDPNNARRHDARNVGLIEESIKRVGPARPVLVDEQGLILAGNATQRAAIAGGLEAANVIDADGETLVAVRVRGLTDEDKRFLSLSDNRAAQLASWDGEAVERLIADGFEDQINAIFYPNELQELLEAEPLAEPLPSDPDAMPSAWGDSTFRPPLLVFGKFRLYMLNDAALATLTSRLTAWKRSVGAFDGLISAALDRFRLNQIEQQIAAEQATDALDEGTSHAADPE